MPHDSERSNVNRFPLSLGGREVGVRVSTQRVILHSRERSFLWECISFNHSFCTTTAVTKRLLWDFFFHFIAETSLDPKYWSGKKDVPSSLCFFLLFLFFVLFFVFFSSFSFLFSALFLFSPQSFGWAKCLSAWKGATLVHTMYNHYRNEYIFVGLSLDVILCG